MSRRLLLAALLLLPSGAYAEDLPVAVYRERLVAIDARLQSGDWVGARTAARDLLDDKVVDGRDVLAPDLSVLRPLAEAPTARAARSAGARVARLAAALAAAAPARPAPADEKLLAEVRARQALAELPEGGALPQKNTGLLEALADFLRPFAEWVEATWEKLMEWLARLWPDAPDKPVFLGLDVPSLVTILVVVLAAIALWLGVRAIRNRRRRAPAAPAAATPPPPAADEDPLSRGANEWERYGAELAAAGRFREAIRAWYHAVLVTLFRRGALHFRKGRTNWEYVAALAPGYEWRPRFIELTRHFEREWYGRDRSTAESFQEAEDMARSLLADFVEAA